MAQMPNQNKTRLGMFLRLFDTIEEKERDEEVFVRPKILKGDPV